LTGERRTNIRDLPGVDPDAVAGFLDALDAACERLRAIPARLEAARVHDEAFGKLIDAAKVRDAYHDRLPATENNIGEACGVVEHFAAVFAAAPVPPETGS
jgi:hypothetical protein